MKSLELIGQLEKAIRSGELLSDLSELDAFRKGMPTNNISVQMCVLDRVAYEQRCIVKIVFNGKDYQESFPLHRAKETNRERLGDTMRILVRQIVDSWMIANAKEFSEISEYFR